MFRSDLLTIGGAEVRQLLEGAEGKVVDLVREAYRIHAQGDSSLPHSSFLRFPGRPADRIIALPGYLGGSFQAAGIKWIASVPANVEQGLERASASIILNDAATGHPQALLEGSYISAARTAASAALAAQVLGAEGPVQSIGVIGCGRIALECVRFLRQTVPQASHYRIFDLNRERAQRFAAILEDRFSGLSVDCAENCEAVLTTCPMTAFVTTAIVPHVEDLSMCPPGSTILHVSLRDLSAEAILASDNVVDDLDHVCRAQTSIHLASEQCGHRDFVRASLGEILNGAEARPDANGCTVFSPFGLGVLDLALSQWIFQKALEEGMGTPVKAFLDGETV